MGFAHSARPFGSANLRARGAEAVGNAIRLDNCDMTEEDLIAILEDVNEEKKNISV